MKNINSMSVLLVVVIALSSVVFAQSNQIMPCLSDSLKDERVVKPGVRKGVYIASAKWIPGQKIRVRFLDGSEFLKSKIRLYAQVWEQFANIDFTFVETGDAEIRVSFATQKGASWSLLGKSSEKFSIVKNGNATESIQSNNETSMNFGWFDSMTPETEFRRTTLHEFGHALGLQHEHQNSNRNFEWNEPAVFEFYARTMNWSRDRVQSQILDRYGAGSESTNGEYDARSIMHYPIAAILTKSGIGVGGNSELSVGDKNIAEEMYPFDESSNRNKPTPQTPTTPKPTTPTVVQTNAKVFTFKDVFADFDVVETKTDEVGVDFLFDFEIKNAAKQEHSLVIYFYQSNGTPLKDTNKKFYAVNGNVAVFKKFTPTTQSEIYKEFTIFIPYSEFELSCGNHRLKYSIGVWQGTKRVATTGFSYFTYNQPCED